MVVGGDLLRLGWMAQTLGEALDHLAAHHLRSVPQRGQQLAPALRLARLELPARGDLLGHSLGRRAGERGGVPCLARRLREVGVDQRRQLRAVGALDLGEKIARVRIAAFTVLGYVVAEDLFDVGHRGFSSKCVRRSLRNLLAIWWTFWSVMGGSRSGKELLTLSAVSFAP